MLSDTFTQVYTKFKLNFYRGMFRRLQERESSLSASEAFAVEIIHAMHEPTISRFADFINVSMPNANYKVNSLVRKGYIEKVNSTVDRREYHLKTTSRFADYYAINQAYIDTVMNRINQRFSADELAWFEHILQVISDELMPESSEKLS